MSLLERIKWRLRGHKPAVWYGQFEDGTFAWWCTTNQCEPEDGFGTADGDTEGWCGSLAEARILAIIHSELKHRWRPDVIHWEAPHSGDEAGEQR